MMARPEFQEWCEEAAEDFNRRRWQRYLAAVKEATDANMKVWWEWYNRPEQAELRQEDDEAWAKVFGA